jgi:uncharacterized protein YdaU (DUF1376 family)
MAEFAALPLFTDAWIADTAHLSRAERGLYHDLLVLMWRSPECRVPNDIAWIERHLRADPEERPALEMILKEFCRSDGNFVMQKRLKKEHNYTRAKRKIQSANAKLRWDKEKRPCDGNAPSPSPSPLKKEEERTTPSLREGPLHDVKAEVHTLNSEKKSPEKKAPRKTRLPEFFPEEAERVAAAAYWGRVGRPDLSFEEEGEKFRAYHLAQADTSASWPHSWKTWYVNAPKFNKNEGIHGKSNGKRRLDACFRGALAALESTGGSGRANGADRGQPGRESGKTELLGPAPLALPPRSGGSG